MWESVLQFLGKSYLNGTSDLYLKYKGNVGVSTVDVAHSMS